MSNRRGQWLEAAADITAALLSEAPRTQALQLVASRARAVARADVALVLLPSASVDGDERLVVEVADGQFAEASVGQDVAAGLSLDGLVFEQGRPHVVDGLMLGLEGLGKVLLLPMKSSAGPLGMLALARRGSPEWSADDERLAGGFAEQAALALELARAHSDRSRIAVYEDRDRIARDLHDLVVQRIFAVGLSLRNVGRLDEEQRNLRIERAMDDLDATVKEVRRTIFHLHRRPGEGDLRADLDALTAGARTMLGFAPKLEVEGDLRGVPDPVAFHVLAVVREALSNVARHAQASSVVVSVCVTDGTLSVDVKDDGIGIGELTRRSGLANMQNRAQSLGGSLHVEALPRVGTKLSLSLPLELV